MHRTSFATIAAITCLTALPLAAGCSAADTKEEPRPPATMAPTPGMELVRGVVGASQPGSADAADPQLRELADAVAAEIDAEAPGRLAQIVDDLRSRDGERVVAAKILLDRSLADAARSSTFARGAGQGSLLTQSLHPLDGTGTGSGATSSGSPLVDAGQQLLCEQPKGTDGMPLHLGRTNGSYGDGRTGASGALGDTTDLVDTTDVNVLRTLGRVDSGALTPDPESRLGAYAATRGYPAGTVGNAVHNAIGTIYVTFANYGQEKIGRVFNAPEAKALYDQPVASCAGMQMALLEYQYWQDVTSEDGFSPGGRMGSMFNPTVRNLLQTNVFAGKP